MVLGGLFFLFHYPWVDFSALENYNPGRPTRVLDDEGNEFMCFQLDRRDPIPLNQMPDHLIKAFIAAEDQSFFSHGGISFRGIVRSMLVNARRGKIVQGASTITQQLVKLLFFDSRRTFERKIKEQFLALFVERQFSKEQIIEIYLNHIYLGAGIYGVEAASQRFWSKHACDLTVAESATLAAIVRSPERYCPLNSVEHVFSRRNIILGIMRRLGFITAPVYEESRRSSVVITGCRSSDYVTYAPHLREMVRAWAEEMFGKQSLYQDGLVIQTTINSRMQHVAHTTFEQRMRLLRSEMLPGIDGAMVCLEAKTGALKALIGGYDFNHSQFNRATQAHRQIGSIIKPFVYAIGIEHGMRFTDVELDEPLVLVENGQSWSPQNHNQKFLGPMTRARALFRSNNIIAIKTLLGVGITTVSARLRDIGITGYIPPYPSLALGCVESTVLDATALMGIFAQQGLYVKPYFVEWVKDASGKKIWRHAPTKRQVMSWSITSQVVKVLSVGMHRMRCGVEAGWPQSEIMGKTGTTNDARSCWFVGATPDFITGMYIGHDDNSPMGKDVYAVSTIVPLWCAFNRRIEKRATQFAYDPSLQEVLVHEFTGEQLYDRDDPQALALLVAQ